jgi:hypothetical protein
VVAEVGWCEVMVTSTGSAGACCGGGRVGLLQLSFWNVVKGWVLCSFGDGGESLSGWLLEWGLVFVGSSG